MSQVHDWLYAIGLFAIGGLVFGLVGFVRAGDLREDFERLEAQIVCITAEDEVDCLRDELERGE